MQLPYEKNILEPHISVETFDYHYDKHYKTYLNKLNLLIKKTEFENLDLQNIIDNSSGIIYNNAAQVWNHEFYWKGLSKEKFVNEKQSFFKKINQEEMNVKKSFIDKAMQLFGSGWCWFVISKENELKIINTSNADIPKNYKILLTCDIWEHAYYIDYRNNRLKYLETFWQLINWKFVYKNLVS